MKKTYRLFSMVCLAGAMAFLASSCKKNENTESVQVILPEFEEVMVEPIDAGKAYIDFQTGGTFRWRDNDTVMFYNIDNAGQKTRKAYYVAPEGSEGATRARFTSGSGAVLGDRMDHFFVFYPVNRIKNGLNYTPGTENYETFLVPMEQKYTQAHNQVTVDPHAMAMAAETYSVEGGVMLNHIFGIVRLVMKSDNATKVQRVDRIELIDNSLNLNGEVSMRLHKVDMERFHTLMQSYTWANVGLSNSFYAAWNEYNREGLGYQSVTDEDHNGTGYTVALDCVDPETGLGVKVAGTPDDPNPYYGYSNFYISVRPGALINGFTLKVYVDGNTTDPIVINSFENPSATNSNDLYSVKAGQVNFFGVQAGLDTYR